MTHRAALPVRQKYSRQLIIPVHRHRASYAAVVLEGGYDEYGPDGRWSCRAGDIVVHPPSHLHGDRFHASGGQVIDVQLRTVVPGSFGVYRLSDIDLLFRAVESREADDALAHLLPRALAVAPQRPPDRISRIASSLAAHPALPVEQLAVQVDWSREHATRSFSAWFGVSPGAYRREHRARRALEEVRGGTALAAAAAAAGFADQAHMTRAFRSVFGATPGRCRSDEVTPVQ